MEIDIKIRLQDADIDLLIKSLFELLKKVPADRFKVETVPATMPPSPPPIWNDTSTTPYIKPKTNIDYGTAGKPNSTDDNYYTVPEDSIFYSNNGETIKKMDDEKKNEENQE